MPVFLEFLLVAFLIYLWESSLWLPRQGIALRRGWFGKKWKAIIATRLIATRELGLVPMLPFPPDAGLAPCPRFPLSADAEGKIFIDSADGIYLPTHATRWEDIAFSEPRLSIARQSVRCQSPRCIADFREGKIAGENPCEAIRHAWTASLSPARAKAAIKRWKIANLPLRLYCPMLTLGFFAGIPAAFLYLPPLSTLWLAAWLWTLMVGISLHLFWISKNVYPEARAEIRQDAWLSLFVPFHAMRAMELVSVHAFALTHPAAILIASGQTAHPWLASLVRELKFPRPNQAGDLALAASCLPPLEQSLAIRGVSIARYLEPPDRSEDMEASAWCPRCHGMFLPGPTCCNDCGGLELKHFE